MIARKSFLIITSKIIDGLFGYIGLFFITRYMSPYDYGVIAFAIGFVTLFSIFTNFGFNSAHIKRVSEGKILSKCIGTYLSVRFLLIFFASLLLLGTIFVWKKVMGLGFESPQHETAIYIIMIFWIIELVSDTLLQTFRAKKEIAKFQIPLLANTFIRTGAIAYVAVAGYGVFALAFCYVAGAISRLILSIIFFLKLPVSKPDKECLKDYSVFAWPLILVSVSAIIMSNIDKVFIQLFWSSEDVGYYFAAFRFTTCVTLFNTAIGYLIFPTYSKLHVENKIDKIRSLTFDTERYLSIIVFPMVFGMVVLSEPIAKILLSGWTQTIILLQVIPFVGLFKALSTPYESQFNGMNMPKINRNRILIMFVCNIFLNIILIPEDIQSLNIKLAGLGAYGAAIATVVSYLISFIYTRIMSYRLTGAKGNIRILIHFFSSIVMTFIIYLLLYQLNLINVVSRWYHLIFISFMGLGIYLFVLIMLKEFTKKDLDLFLDTINVKKMISYIYGELRRK